MSKIRYNLFKFSKYCTLALNANKWADIAKYYEKYVLEYQNLAYQ